MEFPAHLNQKAVRFGSDLGYYWRKSDLPELLDWFDQNGLIIQGFEVTRPLPVGRRLLLDYSGMHIMENQSLRKFDHLSAEEAAKRSIQEFQSYLDEELWLEEGDLFWLYLEDANKWNNRTGKEKGR